MFRPRKGAKMTPYANRPLYEARRKSTLLCYLLWFFLGPLGVHRLYCGRRNGLLMPTIIVVGSLLALWFPEALFVVGVSVAAAIGVWLLVDAFLIYGWVGDHNLDLVERRRQ